MRRTLFLLAAAMLVAGRGSAQQLVPATEPTLVNCNNQPCFRLTLNAVDAAGNPRGLAERNFTVTENGRKHDAFFVSTDTPAAARSTYWMLLLDLSGSMRRKLGSGTRLDAARQAIREAIGDIREGIDHFALVPFESHRVKETVSRAVFDTNRASALARLAAIPKPGGNTALYTAMDEALQVLKPYEAEGNDVALLVFSDGKNDVDPAKGDDRDLLGDEGLAIVRDRARQSNIQIRTIGFGAKNEPSFDESALRQLAFPDERNYAYAATAAEMRGLLAKNALALASRVRLTFGPVRDSKGQLRAETLNFHVTAGSGGATLETKSPITWVAPPLQEPAFTDVLTADEDKAFFRTGPEDADGPGPESPWLPRLIALGIFSAILAIGWFGVPRFLWPERYIPKPIFPPGTATDSRPAYEGAGGRPPAAGPGSSSTMAGGGGSRRMSPADREPPRRDPRPPARPRPAPPRGVDDSTVYIPRGKKYEKDV